MATLTVTSRGQVTLRKEFLQHIGVGPGDKIDLEKSPDGKLTLGAVRPKGRWDSFIGCLADKTDVRLTIEEMNEAIGDAIVAEFEEGVRR
jgi:bifunctional DNA-binding transcriptional regulator/antitoxin component of YhaV-PrlF toxin-antitoxin module